MHQSKKDIVYTLIFLPLVVPLPDQESQYSKHDSKLPRNNELANRQKKKSMTRDSESSQYGEMLLGT